MSEQETLTKTKKGKGPLFWIGAVCCGCLLLFGCLCSVVGLLTATNKEFKDNFKKGYCDEWIKQGRQTSADPFKLCK